jgi:hypothetical protein
LFKKQKRGTHNNVKRFTQHCEDAPDLKGYKKFHLGLPVFSEKIWKN